MSTPTAGVPGVVSLVTLGVADVAASTRFYRQLGFELSPASVEGEVSFFRTAGGLLGLYGADDLRHDANALGGPVAPGVFRGVAFAINVGSREHVDAALLAAGAAGARIAKPAQATEWGGYHGYFADPDGHLWEIAHNPFWPIGPDGPPAAALNFSISGGQGRGRIRRAGPGCGTRSSARSRRSPRRASRRCPTSRHVPG